MNLCAFGYTPNVLQGVPKYESTVVDKGPSIDGRPESYPFSPLHCSLEKKKDARTHLYTGNCVVPLAETFIATESGGTKDFQLILLLLLPRKSKKPREPQLNKHMPPPLPQNQASWKRPSRLFYAPRSSLHFLKHAESRMVQSAQFHG